MRHRITRFAGLGAVLAAVMALTGCFGPKIDEIDYVISKQFTRDEVFSWSLQDVEIVIPDSMKVWTDPDVRYPTKKALVWWGDPPGDRKEQVRTLMRDAVRAGALDALAGDRAVILRIDIIEFHAMTPKARASELPFGVHEIKFDATVIDANTGEVILLEPGMNSDLQAFSGTSAIQAVEVGQTQKVRIQARVASVIRRWLNDVGA